MRPVLTADAVAAELVLSAGWLGFNSGRQLVGFIQHYLDRWGLTRISALDVADAVLRILNADGKPQTPEESAWEDNLRQGIGDQGFDDQAAIARMDGLALAGRVAAMSMEEFGAERERLGVAKGTFGFLAGT